VDKKFVIVQFEVHCSWSDVAPAYRVFVNNELFSERTFIWKDHYLVENLQINALPGKYQVRFEPIGQEPDAPKFKVKNKRVKVGPARWLTPNTVEILNART